MILPSPFGCTSAKQSPPMPVDCGSITPSMAQAATAASTAVPPARMISIAASAACGCDVATIPFWAWTVDRPANWKFLMPKVLALSVFCCGLSRKRAYMAHSMRRWAMLVGGWRQCFSGSSRHLVRWRGKGRITWEVLIAFPAS